MFNFGISSSFSVYMRFFFFTGPGAGFVFCCFGGGALGFFEIRPFVLPPDAPDLLDCFELFTPLTKDLTVLVGPIAILVLQN